MDDTRKNNIKVHDEGFKYWLEVIDLLSAHSPILIFQNEKSDRTKAIDLEGIKSRFTNVMALYSGNLERKDSVTKLRRDIEARVQLLPHIGEELPSKWISVRSELEEISHTEPHITLKEYFGIYRKHLEFDREKALYLSHYLHDLGVFLHFQEDPVLKNIVILQNEWATEAVFKMLDDEAVKSRQGHFSKEDCARLWRNSLYSGMHDELISLMEKFELCYKLNDIRNETWLAPQLLPPSQPNELLFKNEQKDLVLLYKYEFLPKGIVSRLIVRLHRFFIRPNLGWSSGALFEKDTIGYEENIGERQEKILHSELLVEVPANGNEIVLRSRGPECKELLTVVSSDLEALNESFRGLPSRITKWIPCNCSRCQGSTEPEFFEQKRLLQRKRDNRLTVECPSSYEDVDVLRLIDGISINRMPRWAGEAIKQVKHYSKVRTFKIFLASSFELKEDRDDFDLYFRQQNDRLRNQGIYLEIVRWENFLDAMSETRLQDEYNKEVKACDIFVSLFFSKTGGYTEEEFDIAHQKFIDTKKPLIYTFFKNAPLDSGSIGDEINSLLNFKKKLDLLGHFYTNYNNIEHLKLQFKDQLDKLREKGI